MPGYEYKVIPAPNRAVRVKGIKGTEARFANAVQTVMNDQAADGWQYLRTDTLPCLERQGLRARVTVYQNLLVFRREVAAEVAAVAPEVVAEAPTRLVLQSPVPDISEATVPGNGVADPEDDRLPDHRGSGQRVEPPMTARSGD